MKGRERGTNAVETVPILPVFDFLGWKKGVNDTVGSLYEFPFSDLQRQLKVIKTKGDKAEFSEFDLANSFIEVIAHLLSSDDGKVPIDKSLVMINYLSNVRSYLNFVRNQLLQNEQQK